MSDFRNCMANWSGNGLELPWPPAVEAQEAIAVCQEQCSSSPALPVPSSPCPQPFCGISAASWL